MGTVGIRGHTWAFVGKKMPAALWLRNGDFAVGIRVQFARGHFLQPWAFLPWAYVAIHGHSVGIRGHTWAYVGIPWAVPWAFQIRGYFSLQFRILPQARFA